MSSSLLLLLLVCVQIAPRTAQNQFGAFVGLDDAGNVIVNSSISQRVIVNGVDVQSLSAEVASLRETQAAVARLVQWSPFGKLFVAGGHFKTYLGSAERFDGVSSFQNVSGLTIPRFGGRMVNFFGALHFVGGWSGIQDGTSLPVHKTVERFNGFLWEVLPAEMQTPRAGHGAVVFQRRIFAVAGWDGGKLLSSVESFDGISWQSAPSLVLARSEVSTAVFEDTIFCVGGHVDQGKQNMVEFFDGIAWQREASMALARSKAGIVVFNNILYIIGGEGQARMSDQAALTSSIEYKESRGGTPWKAFANPLPAPREQFDAVVVNNQMCVLGGLTPSGPTGALTCLDPSTNAWRDVAELSLKRGSFGSAFMGDF